MWIESQRPLRKQETQTVAWTEHRAQEEEHNAHRPLGWVCVTVRQRAPGLPIHLHRACLDAGVRKLRLQSNVKQTLIDIRHRERLINTLIINQLRGFVAKNLLTSLPVRVCYTYVNHEKKNIFISTSPVTYTLLLHVVSQVSPCKISQVEMPDRT